jgi:hypothetical protein
MKASEAAKLVRVGVGGASRSRVAAIRSNTAESVSALPFGRAVLAGLVGRLRLAIVGIPYLGSHTDRFRVLQGSAQNERKTGRRRPPTTLQLGACPV